MRFVAWFLVGLLAAILWLLFGPRERCPSCGLPLEDSELDELATTLWPDRRSCRRCGWGREA